MHAHIPRHTHAHSRQVCTRSLHQWRLELLVPCVPPEAATSKVEVDSAIPLRTITDDRVNLNGAE